MKDHQRRKAGITLIEVLVAMTIFSMVVAGVMRFSDYATRRIFTVRNDVEHLDRLVFFLKTLSSDVRDSRQILYSAPTEIGIWRLDENADSAPEPLETVGYAWDGESSGNLFRQAGEDTSVILSNVRNLKFSYDDESPRTRHVILEMSVGKSAATIQRYHFSLNLRAAELH